MEFYMKLPRTKKEFGLFMAIISIISVLPFILVKCRCYCSVGVHTRRENDGKNHRKRGQLQCTYYC